MDGIGRGHEHGMTKEQGAVAAAFRGASVAEIAKMLWSF